jgi:hypothetical protein
MNTITGKYFESISTINWLAQGLYLKICSRKLSSCTLSIEDIELKLEMRYIYAYTDHEAVYSLSFARSKQTHILDLDGLQQTTTKSLCRVVVNIVFL